MDDQSDSKEFYSQHGVMTFVEINKPSLEDLPKDIFGLVSVVQGLMIHQWLTRAYGVEASLNDRNPGAHTRSAEGLLDNIRENDKSSLTCLRSPEKRLLATCRQFTVMMVALLRAQGTPARARCGFGGYFGTKAFEDHWVCEYWDSIQQRWILIDAQIDEKQRKFFPIDFDTLDVPKDKFVVAGQAWSSYRSGEADPTSFAISSLNESGAWLVAQNLIRDFAALNNMEMLPWDVWGAMPSPINNIDDEQLALFDRLAILTQDPDKHFTELRMAYKQDVRVKVPASVRNHIMGCDEKIYQEISTTDNY